MHDIQDISISNSNCLSAIVVYACFLSPVLLNDGTCTHYVLRISAYNQIGRS